MEDALPKENKTSDPRGASTMDALVENKPYSVNKQKMNGPVRDLEFGRALVSRHFMVAAKKQE